MGGEVARFHELRQCEQIVMHNKNSILRYLSPFRHKGQRLWLRQTSMLCLRLHKHLPSTCQMQTLPTCLQLELLQRQVRHFKVKWTVTGDLTPAPIEGCPTRAAHIHAQHSFQNKLRTNPVCTVAQLSSEAGVSQRTGGRVMEELELCSRA